jgi:hypothetical protein
MGLASWVTPTGGGISGGQANYGTRWITATTLGTGSVFDNGTNVGIGTSTPGAKLDVSGDAAINGVTVGRGGGNVATNTVSGLGNLQFNTTG